MAYATTTDLEGRFEDDEELTFLTDNVAAGVPDTDVEQEVIDDAEGVVDSYVGMRYAVPVAGTDTQLVARLKSLTLDIASYKLEARTRKVSEARLKQYDDAILWLEKIAEGSVILPSAITEAATVSREPGAAFGQSGTVGGTTNLRVFSRSSQGSL